MRHIILALLVAMALPTTVRAQESARDRAQRVLPAEVFQSLAALAEEGASSGIPTEPLFSKALEGLAKRVPASRLMPAIQSYASRLG